MCHASTTCHKSLNKDAFYISASLHADLTHWLQIWRVWGKTLITDSLILLPIIVLVYICYVVYILTQILDSITSVFVAARH